LISNDFVKNVSMSISNSSYRGKIEETMQLMDAIEKYNGRALTHWEQYVNIYDWSGFTFKTWEELLQSELEQSEPMSEEECLAELNHTIFKLPCGWYVQFV
jgi:hypothetical protein